MGGLSIDRPVPIIKRYSMPAIVSQIPLTKNVTAKGLRLFLFIYPSPSISDKFLLQEFFLSKKNLKKYMIS